MNTTYLITKQTFDTIEHLVIFKALRKININEKYM